MEGLDQEVAKIERDEKLLTVVSRSGTTKRTKVDSISEDISMEYVQMSKEDVEKYNVTVDSNDDEDWEEADLLPKTLRPEDAVNKECQQLATATVSRIANANVKVASPLGALSLALHTTLLELSTHENQSIFRCTGVPDFQVTSQFLGLNETKKSTGGGGGFAPPIRELRSLVPAKWEGNVKANEGIVSFRYKCGSEVYSTNCAGPTNDASTVYLALQQKGDDVLVSFGTLPSSDKDVSSTKQLTFPLSSAVNLEGFRTAASKGGDISPSLFYISLPKLLHQFCSTFEVLPSMQQQKEEAAAVNMAIDTATSQPFPTVNVPLRLKKEKSRAEIPPDGVAINKHINNNIDPLRMTNPQDRRGDFDADLRPGNLPGFAPPSQGGNQVGPNHPMFDRSFGEDHNDDNLGYGTGGSGFNIPGVGGGIEMRPRFDPFGPPGGPQEVRFPGRGGRLGAGRGRGGRSGRCPPGGVGNPNNDHIRPPNSDYFS